MKKLTSKTICKRVFWWSLGLSILPAISLLLASVLSNLLNCDSAVSGINSCRVGGAVMGEVLYAMFTFGWVTFFSIPIGLLVAAVAGVSYVVNVKKK